MDQLHGTYLTFEQFFFNYSTAAFHKVFFTKFLKLDPDQDPHLKAAGSGSGSKSAKNECGSPALYSSVQYKRWCVTRHLMASLLKLNGAGNFFRPNYLNIYQTSLGYCIQFIYQSQKHTNIMG